MSGSMGSLPLIGGLGAAGIFAGGKTAVEKFANRESQETSIKFLSKTEQEGKSNLAFLRNLSKEYGVSFSGMLDGYKQLKANMNMMDIAPEEQNNKFKKISAAIRVMGLDAQASSSVFYAFSQMMSKGSIQAQELKLQLANAYPSAVPSLAKSMGVSIKYLNKMLDAGAISWKKYGDNFIDFMYNDVKKGIPNAVNTVSAGIARISNTIENAWVGIGDAIAKSGALDVISQMGKELEVWVSANKEMIASSIKGGVDFVKKGFEWAVAHKTEIGSILSNMTKFIGVVTATNLVVAFSDPMRLAALAVGGMAVAIWNAVEKMKEVRSEETKLKQNKPFKFYESAMAGVSNIGFGFGNAIAGNYKAPVFSQILGGAAQIVMSVPQAAAEGINWVRRDAGDGKPITGIGKLGEMMGSASLGIDKYTRPEDYAPNNESVLRNEVLNLNTSKAAQDASARESERVSVDTISTAVMKGIEMGMYGLTINVDADGRKTMQFAGAKGPGINVEKN